MTGGGGIQAKPGGPAGCLETEAGRADVAGVALQAYRWKKLLVSGERLTPPAA